MPLLSLLAAVPPIDPSRGASFTGTALVAAVTIVVGVVAVAIVLGGRVRRRRFQARGSPVAYRPDDVGKA